MGALDLYWGEGAFGSFQFQQHPLELWACIVSKVFGGYGLVFRLRVGLWRIEEDPRKFFNL